VLGVIGTNSADTIKLAGQNAVGIGTDDDVDINVRKPAPAGGVQPVSFSVNGLGGGDFITDRGGFPNAFPPAATSGISMEGGGGRDTLVDGLGNDTLRGGSDDDTLFSADGVGHDFLFGGSGIDTATIDGGDFRDKDVEKVKVG
jgi:Ca2+-binding RTX toxin-like protein